MKRVVVLLALLLVPVSSAMAQGFDTLEYYMSKSDLVASATLASSLSAGLGYSTKAGEFYVFCDFKIEEVLFGTGPKTNLIEVCIVKAATLGRSENWPYLKHNPKCILFLKRKGSRWWTADPWFGIQPDNIAMAHGVKWVVRQQKKQRKSE